MLGPTGGDSLEIFCRQRISLAVNRFGEELRVFLSGATAEVLLIAPFIKAPPLVRLIEGLPATVGLTVVTRWKAEEIFRGVSDLDVLDIVLAHSNARLLLCGPLHAKIYRADERYLIGSANLTAKALGWTEGSNIEVLSEPDRDGVTALRVIEEEILGQSIPASFELKRQLEATIEMLRLCCIDAKDLLSAPIGAGKKESWRPSLRSPHQLFDGYDQSMDTLSTAARECCERDLLALGIPSGLTKREFESVVASKILSCEEFQAIEREIGGDTRRFGDMRRFLASRNSSDPSADWQAWIRWIVHFLPGRYSVLEKNYSELICRKPT